jgi:hypothetical protein
MSSYTHFLLLDSLEFLNVYFNNSFFFKFEVLTAVLINIMFFWDVMLCMWQTGTNVLMENTIANFSETLVTRFKEETRLFLCTLYK